MPSKNTVRLQWPSATYEPEALKVRDSKELRKEYSRLRDIAQKRLIRLGTSEFSEGSTYRHYKDVFPKLSEIKTEAQLRQRLAILARFVESKASTVSGIKAKRTAQIRSLQEQGYDWIDESNFDNFIRDDDFANVKNMGYDHIRVPVDYELIED